MRSAQTIAATSLSGRLYRVTRRPTSVQIDFGQLGSLVAPSSQWENLSSIFRNRFPRADQTNSAGPFVLRGYEQSGAMMASIEASGHPAGVRPIFWLNEADFKTLAEAVTKLDSET